MKTAIFLVLAVAALGAIGVTTTVMNSAITAHAAGPADQSNPVAKGATTNGGYQTGCQQTEPAQDCATDPISGNGPFTSGLAHNTNKP
jgi:hypothetical protein